MNQEIVFFSGGIGSAATALKLLKMGKKPLLLFTDTKIEDPDLYKFLDTFAKRQA